MKHLNRLTLVAAVLLLSSPVINASSPEETYFLKIPAKNNPERTKIAELGVAIEEVMSDYVFGTAPLSIAQRVKTQIAKTLFYPASEVTNLDFPARDSEYHNFDEVVAFLDEIKANYPDLVTIESIGTSVEGRNLYSISITSHTNDLPGEVKPAIIFLGTHHAREHLSTEVPLYLVKRLLEEYGTNQQITDLINRREIYIIPVVNPDGTIYDVEDAYYHYWRKNRAINRDRSYGVDLNRNYGFMWGGPGSSGNTQSEIYRGPTAWSEPEVKAVRDFIVAHNNISILLSYHTYSELILYPWGYTETPIEDKKALKTYETMAGTMAEMTGYSPMPSHELYLASGDTTDWAWGELGIFSFTFELYPSRWGRSGFYPPDEIIPEIAASNFGPALYLIDLADDPYRAAGNNFMNPVYGKLTAATF